MADIPLFVGLAFILTHELDAVRLHEWRFLPIFSRLSDNVAAPWFVFGHIPLVAGLLAALFWNGAVNTAVAIGFDVFLIVHVALHVLALRHPKNEFTQVWSWVAIVGAGIAGAVDLIMRAPLL